MATLKEITDEAERLYPKDRDAQRRHVQEKLEYLGDDALILENIKSQLQPTAENAAFVKKLEEVDNLDRLVNPPLLPPVKTQPQPIDPKDEDVDYLTDLVEKFGTNTPSRIDGYTDDQLEMLIDMGSYNEEEAREELTARKSGSITNKVKRLAGQYVAGAAEVPTSGPIALTGILAKAAEFLTGADLQSDAILGISNQVREDVRKRIGISEPRDILESAAGVAGSITPIPGVAAPTGALGNAVELVTPLVVGSGNKRVAANFMFAGAAEQGMRELADTAADEYKTVFDAADLTGPDDTNYPKTLGILATGMGLLTGTTLLTSAVMQKMRNSAATRLVEPEPVRMIDPAGPENLKSIEKSKDVYKTYLIDEKTVLSDLAARAKVGNLPEVKHLIDQDTQTAALMRINEAMRVGKLRTSTGSWDVDITPNQLLQSYKRLPTAIQQDVDHYLKYKDLTDVLQSRIDKLTKKLDKKDITDKQFMAWSRELDEAQDRLVTARQSAFTIEQRTPEVTDFSSRYKHIVQATRSFLAQGDSAMLSPKTLQEQEKYRPNFVPSDLLYVDPTGGIMQRITDANQPINQRHLDDWYRGVSEAELDISKRVDSFEVLVDYTRSALKAKMENDVRSAYTRAMFDSVYGGDTIRPASKKEIEKYPDRVVEVWENGKKESYLSSRLQANLLRFDPYIAKYPTMFMAKRLFEHGTTGPLSLTFAPVTAIRDALGGWILKESGAKGPLGPELLLSAPKQVWAKMQLAFVDLLQNNADKIPFFEETTKLNWAKQVSNSYMNSFYHMANEVGGFDASLMKQNIQAGQGVLRELAKTADATASVVPGLKTLGHSFQALAHGFANMFDAIAEAPRFAAFQRNVKSGMDASEAALKARSITGDTTRSGRVYNSRQQRITGDVTNRGRLAPAPVIGAGIEFIREATPYFNPMVQGFRRLTNAIIEDPVGVNLRAWTGVGLPAMAALAWNEMLGEDYNKFAFERRSSRDIAMNLYIGIPGKPPEEGIQIPIAHELMLYNSPWTTGLYSVMKGSDSEEVTNMVQHMGLTALENSAMIGFPQIGTAIFAAAGENAPDSIVDPWNWAQDVYQIREDNAGLLPSNIELMAREMFGGIADTAALSASALYDGGPEAFAEEFANSMARRLPIVKNVTGNISSVSNFTPLSEEKYNKVRALTEFLKVYDEHIEKPQMMRMNKLPSSKGLVDDEAEEFTTQRLAPIPTPAPTNPIFLEYGKVIKDTLDRNSDGATGLNNRLNLLSAQIRSLKTYTAGRKDAFKKWQEQIQGSDILYQTAMEELESRRDSLTKDEYKKELAGLRSLSEKAKADRMITELKLDMSNRKDVIKLINHLEIQKIELMKEQLKLVELAEDRVTADMQARGLLPPGKRFDLERDLKPY